MWRWLSPIGQGCLFASSLPEILRDVHRQRAARTSETGARDSRAVFAATSRGSISRLSCAAQHGDTIHSGELLGRHEQSAPGSLLGGDGLAGRDAPVPAALGCKTRDLP